MQRWKSSAWLLLTLCIQTLSYLIDNEQFDEELVLRPLQDGRVLSRFSFRTLLKNATPRDPQTLGSDDLRECH